MDVLPSPTYALPDEVADKLICSTCEGYLSCGPVKLENGNFICGRCDVRSNADSSPQTIFEAAMQNFTFPCRYNRNGCGKRVVFNACTEHESTCQHRTYRCPALLNDSCTNSLTAVQFRNHYEKKHDDLIIQDGRFKLNLSQDRHCNLLMIEDNAVIVVKCFYDALEKYLQLDVAQVSSELNAQLTYKIQMFNPSDIDCIVSLSQQKCNVYDSYTIHAEKAVILPMEKYLPILKNPTVVIMQLSLNVTEQEEEHPVSENQLDEVLTSKAIVKSFDGGCEKEAIEKFLALENVRCNSCNVFAIPPMYIYSGRSYVRYCGDCRRANMIVENINVTNYPCRWRGCPFIGTNTNIKEHMDTCTFRLHVCPFYSSCEEGVYRFNDFKHLETHAKYCRDSNNITIKMYNPNVRASTRLTNNTYFTVLDSTIIIFVCNIQPDANWELSSKFPTGIKAKVYFEHDHCRFMSKRYSFTGVFIMEKKEYVNSFPDCFKTCDRVTAVVQVSKVNQD